MTRSILALAALLGLAVSSSTAFANCTEMHVSKDKQTVAAADGKSSKPILPTGQKDG